MDIHNIIIHRDQEASCQHPCSRAGQANTKITSLSCCDPRYHTSSDQLSNTGHHRQQSVSESLDSISVDNALKTINEVKFDAIELRPYYHAIEFLPTFKKVWDGEYYVAGFVNTEEKLKKCKEAGFSGAMTSTVELWNKKFEK